MLKNKYRIVTDMYAGYEVQIKYWWFPIFWFQVSETQGINTHISIDKAKEFIELHKQIGKVVK